MSDRERESLAKLRAKARNLLEMDEVVPDSVREMVLEEIVTVAYHTGVNDVLREELERLRAKL